MATTQKVKNLKIVAEPFVDNSYYATWEFDNKQGGSSNVTDHYEIQWQYWNTQTWMNADSSSTETGTTKHSGTYSPPTNAFKIQVKVKPIAKTYKDSTTKKDKRYFSSTWCDWKLLILKNPLDPPPVPEVSIEGRVLYARLDNLNSDFDKIEFYVEKEYYSGNTIQTGKVDSSEVTISRGTAVYNLTVDPLRSYRVKARAIFTANKTTYYTEWTERSSTVGSMKLKTPKWKKDPYAINDGSAVRIDWEGAGQNAASVEVRYSYDRGYLASNQQEVQSVTVPITEKNLDGSWVGHTEIVGLELGKTWYFQFRAVNSVGYSDWSTDKSIILGKKPEAPTTWSAKTVAMVTDKVKIYWVHNSVDGSEEKEAKIKYVVHYTLYGTETTGEYNITQSKDPKNKDVISYLTIPAPDKDYPGSDVRITWQVRTKGVLDTYGDWSPMREIRYYHKPELSILMKETITQFPLDVVIYEDSDHSLQTPLYAAVNIISTTDYSTYNIFGEPTYVKKGDSLYSGIHAFTHGNRCAITLDPTDIQLENATTYTIEATVSMSSGLTGTISMNFGTSFADPEFLVTGSAVYNPYSYASVVELSAADPETGDPLPTNDGYENIICNIYRQQFDGSFVLISEKAHAGEACPDPHPALDFMRYRIVSIDSVTGRREYQDIVDTSGEIGLIIQWDEAYRSYATREIDTFNEPAYRGTLLRLPYNIDWSDSYTKDCETVSYIGRTLPVAYHGTAISHTVSGSTDIPRDDSETLFLLNRLATWNDVCYVRHPSGSGYWANVEVSYSENHCETVIPVSLSITRVERGEP